MTSPPEQITVECSACGERYRDWFRASLNLNIEHFDPFRLVCDRP